MTESKHLPNDQCTALLDFDVFCYRAAVVATDLDDAIDRFNQRFNETMEEVGCDKYLGLFTPRGRENIFRYHLTNSYKSNRPPSPALLIPLREWVSSEYVTVTGDFCEADDLLGVYAKADTISVTNDKDDLTVPGRKYHFVKKEWYDISEEEAAFNFYCQMLIGDTADGVSGVVGIGKKKSKQALWGLTPDEMFEKVYELYGDHRRFVINYNLLRMWRNPYELYLGRTMGHEKDIVQYKTTEEFIQAVKDLLDNMEYQEDLDILAEFEDD